MNQHRKNFIRIFLALTLLLLLAGLYTFGPYLGTLFGKPLYLLPPGPDRYGRIALDLMETMGIYAGGEDWAQARQEAEAKLSSVDSIDEANPILKQAAKVAGGKHSFIMTAEDSQEVTEGLLADMPTADRQGDVLILTLPGFMGDKTQSQAYADTLARAIDANRDVTGVIVDLRSNTGGDMGPMVAGISPLLPDGEVMAFETRQMTLPVTLEKGRVQGGGTPLKVEVLEKLEVPVAILQGPETASSGEATLLAFKGLPYSQFFGLPTAGYASANQILPLYGGHKLVLTTGKDVDRTGAVYAEDPILPDLETDMAMEAGMAWIQSQ